MCINSYEVCEVDLIEINVLLWKLGSFTIWLQILIKIDILESKKFTRLQKKMYGPLRGGQGTKSMRPFRLLYPLLAYLWILHQTKLKGVIFVS